MKNKLKQTISVGGIALILLGVASLFSGTAIAATTEEEQALEGCFGGCGMLTWFVVGVIVLNIALLVWVARDAKNRGMDSAVIWMLLTLLTGLLGLIIYIFSRPKGNLVQCEHCKNKKLDYAKVCPHCGHGASTK